MDLYHSPRSFTEKIFDGCRSFGGTMRASAND